ncbi:MAG TPA: hypothetical protein VFM14_16000 [Gemmatimonadales bacterium]|nr:hypothetical protein [Gemmatimonadales bacterium]
MHHVATRAFLVLTAAAFGAGAAEAQVGLTSNTAQVSINATKNSTLSVAVTSGATQTLATLTDNTTNNFPTPVAITTTWDLNAGASVALVGWFATPANALVSGGNSITSSQVKASLNGSPTFNAFNGAAVGGVGTAGGSLQIFSAATPPLASSRNDNLALQIDLTATTLVPGTYSGTLNLQAVVQ